MALLWAIPSESRGEMKSPVDDVTRIPVAARKHPEFDASCVRQEAMLFCPKLTSSIAFNSNVFASANHQRSDFAMVLSPELMVHGVWPRFSADARLGAEIYRFNKLTSEDRTNAYAELHTLADVGADVQAEMRLEVARRHEKRGSSDQPADAASPVPYTELSAEGKVTKTFNRLGVTVGATARELTYENVFATNGATLDQSWRNGTIVTTYVKPFYEFAAGYRVFVRADYNSRNYAGVGDLDRDSSGVTVRIGFDAELTPLISGSFEAGYLAQTYNNPAIAPVDGLSFRGKAVWLVTPLTTVTFAAERLVAETTTPGFDGRIDTIGVARIDHELMRNVILFGETTYKHEKFAGAPRKDDVLMVSAGINYLQSRYFRGGVRYDFVSRESTLPAYTFGQHVVTINVSAQY
jgi:hypothetical protein